MFISLFLAVAQNIADKRFVDFDRSRMTVELLKPAYPPPSAAGPHDKTLLHVQNLPSHTTTHELVVYMCKAVGGVSVSNVRFGIENNRALVEYSNIPGRETSNL